jgi:hypothetical protein
MNRLIALTFSTVLFIVLAVPLKADTGHEHKEGDPTKLGKVHFPISCGPASQKKFDVALAMLHSFWYGKSDRAFAELAVADRGCAMAHWGVAMSRFHQIWEAPPPDDLKAGVAALAAARRAGAKTQRERDYIEALGVYYDKSDTLDHLTRFLAFEKAMGELAAKYPKDREATIFYALTLNGVALAMPPDKTYPRQKKAGEILEPIFKEMPEHPGIAHYIIHSYDYPSLAARAVDAARRYAKIAPDSPHALHMPSHIFTRLDRVEPRVGRCRSPDGPGNAAGSDRVRRAPRDGLPRLCLPSDRARRRSARNLRNRVSRREIRQAGLSVGLRIGRDPCPTRAREARLGGGDRRRAATRRLCVEQVPVDRVDGRFRAGSRIRPRRFHGFG